MARVANETVSMYDQSGEMMFRRTFAYQPSTRPLYPEESAAARYYANMERRLDNSPIIGWDRIVFVDYLGRESASCDLS